MVKWLDLRVGFPDGLFVECSRETGGRSEEEQIWDGLSSEC